MKVEIKFITPEVTANLMHKIVDSIINSNLDTLKNRDDIEAIWFIRYTSKTSEDGEVVLRFQKTSTDDFGRLVIPAMSKDEDDDRFMESSVGPLRHVIWTERFNDIFEIRDGRGMNARVFAKSGVADSLILGD